MRRILKILTSRLMIVAPLVILQLCLFIALYDQVSIIPELMPVLSFISIMIVIFIINREEDPAYKIAWILVILSAPVIGVPLYLLAGNRQVPKKLRNGTFLPKKAMEGLLDDKHDVLEAYAKIEPVMQNGFRYAYRASGFPVYQHTNSRYYPSGEAWAKDYIKDLKQAKHFIFMEFFIIDEGSFWEEVLAVLKQKASEGVKVVVIYDDFGSITMPWHYDRQLMKWGIEAYRFNHVRPAFIIQMNNRDHRKITVIDNNVAYTGGVNIADEYVNRIRRFGYWKDTAIRIHGEAVWSFTVMFLGMYSFVSKKHVHYQDYHLPCDKVDDGGYYQPYSDSPTDEETVALNMHLNMINHASRYIYIDSPYLILTDAERQALMRAATSGVDVRIMTPHIPDKRLVFEITRGNYRRLLEAGVRIYEYTPGFIHAKNFVADDKAAIVGSANTDYRSYFLHFENGVLMHHTPKIAEIRRDFEKDMKVSHEVTLEEEKKTWLIVRLIRAVLNIAIPLV